MKLRIATLPALLAVLASGQSTAPDDAERKAVVARMQEAALAYADRLQNFTCTQFLKRSAASDPAGPHWKRLDTQESVLEYVDHKEHYNLVRVNGETLDVEKRIKRGPYFKPGGEFGTILQKIFDPRAQAVFEWDHDETAGGAHTCVFRYNVPHDTSTLGMQADGERVLLAHHGMVWADCATGSVTRFQMATETGEVVRNRLHVSLASRLEVRYSPTMIGTQEFLLPQTATENSLYYKTWTKSEMRFEGYRKYDANSVVKFGEDKN